jgi:hypothetical protein
MAAVRKNLDKAKSYAPRLTGWMALAVVLLVGLAVLQPQQMGVILYKIALVVVAVVVSYAADRSIYGRVDKLNETLKRDTVGAARVLSRAIIFVAVMLGLTQGL